MFRAVWSTIFGLLVDDGQLAIGAIIALAITWTAAYLGGDRAQDWLGWLLLLMILALVIANLYRAGLNARRQVTSAGD
jgi:hypothetical protein